MNRAIRNQCDDNKKIKIKCMSMDNSFVPMGKKLLQNKKSISLKSNAFFVKNYECRKIVIMRI